MSSNKGKSNSWGEVIKADIAKIQQRLTALEAQVQALLNGSNGNFSMGANAGSGGIAVHPLFGTTIGDLTMHGSDFFSHYSASPMSKDNWVQDLVDSTYAIKTATIAVKGYTSALQQAGLSQDQKKLLQELAQIELMIGKLMSTIQLLRLAMTAASPEMMVLNLIMAGGFAASGAASASKIPAIMTSEVS